jgi:hypothetical protein
MFQGPLPCFGNQVTPARAHNLEAESDKRKVDGNLLESEEILRTILKRVPDYPDRGVMSTMQHLAGSLDRN